MLRHPVLATRLAWLLPLALWASSCSQTATNVPVRSLEQSGRVSFICLGPDAEALPAPIEACTSSDFAETYHLYALVTQTGRGEVALIDLTEGSVVDLDPSMPGYNFLPTGAQPVDIVSTPGSAASFVAAGEANKYAIYVLPSRSILDPAPTLTSFAACALPSAPGRMAIVTSAVQGSSAATCDGTLHADVPHDNGDLSLESSPSGARKLIVTMPERGELAVIDAQQLLDQPRGSFDACKFERVIKLRVDLPAVLPRQRTPEGGWAPGVDANGDACVFSSADEITPPAKIEPHPVSLEIDKETGLAYLADDAAPVIHVVDLSDPCSPTERSPLLPMSAVDPYRVVRTRELAVSPTTTDGRKFVYAIDQREGSIMVFDVSLDSTDRTPLMNPYPDRNPFQAPDRISFAVPVKTLAFALRDEPIADPTSGVQVSGVKCDPDVNSSSLGTLFQSSSDYSTGAGPDLLRGIFGCAVLTNGQVVVIDVDDFDAACRRPRGLNACSNETYANYEGATGELSCDVVRRHQTRNAGYLTTGDVSGSRLPGLESYPALTLAGTTLAASSERPMILAPQPKENLAQIVQVGGRPVDAVESNPLTAMHGMVWFDPRESRASYDQDWTVTYEGTLPAFGGHVARLRPSADNSPATVEDSAAAFCWAGVHDFDAAVLVANSMGMTGSAQEPGSPAYEWAQAHVDVVQITDGFLDEEDPYWVSVGGQCSYQSCVETFGPTDVPRSSRDLPILRAWQDRVEVADSLVMAKCCFPQSTSFTIRPQRQWVVWGGVSGFLHRVDVDPVTGRCVDSCDPSLRYRNARAYEGPRVEATAENPALLIPAVDGADVFRNPMMQFWIHPGTAPSERDMTFSFAAIGGFYPVVVNLAGSTSYVQPQSATWVSQIGQLAIPDGSVQGLMMVDLDSLTLINSYY